MIYKISTSCFFKQMQRIGSKIMLFLFFSFTNKKSHQFESGTQTGDMDLQGIAGRSGGSLRCCANWCGEAVY